LINENLSQEFVNYTYLQFVNYTYLSPKAKPQVGEIEK